MAGTLLTCMQFAIILISIPFVVSDDSPVPADKSQLNAWFEKVAGPISGRKGSIEPVLEAAEAAAKVVKVRSDGSGDFKTVTDALISIPVGNKNRVIVSIGPGNFTEKITIPRNKPFVTFYGDPKNMPVLVYDGTAAKYGTVDSATLIVESDYFSAVNIKIVNSAPRPDGVRKLAQAAALRVSGDKNSFFNCKIHGFQDTICDDRGKHLFKDCYIEGTVDFIFGSGKTLYLNTELYVIPGDRMAMITANARKSEAEDVGYSFVHCSVTGSGKHAYLSRAWMSHGRVVYAYCQLSDVINPEGWSNNFRPANNGTVFFGEYQNTGPGAAQEGRVVFVKKLTNAEVKPFISLGFIEGSKWVLPPAKV